MRAEIVAPGAGGVTDRLHQLDVLRVQSGPQRHQDELPERVRQAARADHLPVAGSVNRAREPRRNIAGCMAETTARPPTMRTRRASRKTPPRCSRTRPLTTRSNAPSG